MSGEAHEIALLRFSWWKHRNPASVQVMPPACAAFDAGWVKPNEFVDVYLNNGQRVRVRPA